AIHARRGTSAHDRSYATDARGITRARSRRRLVLAHPLLDVARVGHEAAGEPELDLRLCRLRRVARVHEVAQTDKRVITADRPRRGLVRPCRADHRDRRPRPDGRDVGAIGRQVLARDSLHVLSADAVDDGADLLHAANAIEEELLTG